MALPNKKYFKIALPAVLLTFLVASPTAFAATSPSLGTAESFSILAETTITNVPTSSVSRDVGLSPAAGSFIGLTDAEVGGTIYATDGSAPPAANATVNPGLLTTAINDMMQVWSTGGATGIDQPCTSDYSGTGVKDLTLVSPLGPGVYCADAFILTGNLTLSGSGVWIFKSASTLTTSASSTVTGGDPCNVWFRMVSGASVIGANSTLIGNLLAGTSIAMQTGATLNGRLLAQAAVTLDQNTVSGPACAAPASSGSSSSGSGTGASAASTPGLPDTGFAPVANMSKNASLMSITALVFAASIVSYYIRRHLRGHSGKH